MNNGAIKYALLTSVLLAIFAIGFLLSRSFLFRQTTVQATAEEEDSTVELVQEINADAAKSKFVGEFNGAVFVEPMTPPQAHFPDDCNDEDISDLEGSAAQQFLSESGSAIIPGYLPPDAKPSGSNAIGCRDRAILASQSFRNATGELGVTHYIGWRPFFPAEAPEDRLSASTLSSFQRVMISPVFQGGITKIILTGENETWLVIGVGFPASDVAQVADSLVEQ